MRTKPLDIAVALTRPHRGAITLIKDKGIIASTGFSIIRDADYRVDKEWLLFVLLSNASLQQLLQRSSGGNYPAIIEGEVKHIYLPLLDSEKQIEMVNEIKQSLIKYNQQLDNIDSCFGEGEEYIVKIKFDYIKHNTIIAFPSVIFIKAPFTVMPYTITSKNSPKVVSGEIKITEDMQHQ